MSERRIVGGTKDSNGAYVPIPKELAKPPTPAPESDDITIDDLLKAGLQNIRGAMRAVTVDIGTGIPSRETIQNLKDLMGLLQNLKKDERELLEDISNEELEKMLNK